MFLNKTLELNSRLIETAVQLHQTGKVLPDTYLVDIDQLLYNAKSILNEANKQHIELYYMLKQVGRNPYIAKELENIGYAGAVVVDWKEADVAIKNGLHISHAGHLVQMPSGFVKKIISYGCDYMTIYSIEKLKEIDRVAKEVNKVQKIMVRVIGDGDLIYSGQTAGFYLDELKNLVCEARRLTNVELCGVDSFPCFLYDEKTQDIEPQNNLNTVLKAKKILEELGCHIENVNAPSTTSVRTLQKMNGYGITSAEPGHGLSGTTPLHAVKDCVEKPCVLYLSEVSHNLNNKSYAYGGGYYRRGHLKNAFVGKEINHLNKVIVNPPALDSIDYHFELSEPAEIGASVIMAYRFQVFVTRSDVCLIKGIHENKPEIIGLYNSLGDEITR